MQSSSYYYDEYQEAIALRAEMQAEQLQRFYAVLKGAIKTKVPAFGPLYSNANYSMCMRAMDERTASV